MPMSSFTRVANGNIEPCRFVKLDSTDQGRCVKAGAGEAIFGISQPSERRMALSGWQDGYAAIAGEMINVIGPGDDAALLDIGGPVTYGDYLKSDSAGKGVTAGTDKDNVGAQAMASGVSGDRIQVKPMRFDRAV